MGEALTHTPAITVLMPVYNAAAYVKEAIKSILHQTYNDFELLIINDGSTDQSVSVIESISDKRIVLVHNERNLGLIETLNKGFQLAKGKYIARMDADDVAQPDRLSIQLRYMEAFPECGVFGSAYQEISVERKGKTVTFSDKHDLLKTVLFFNSCMSHPTVMFRKALLNEHQIRYAHEYKHAEDYALWVQLIDKTRFSNSPLPLLKYRLHASQVSSSHTAEQQQTADLIRSIMLQRIGVVPDEAEQELHRKISSGQKMETAETLMQLEAWFKKLIEANKACGYTDHKTFSSYLAAVFADACSGSSRGWKAYYLYYVSDLAEYQSLSGFDKFKLLIKCLLR
jgi:glycosyltransferase involved in cell wall biosynthesis